MSNVGAGILNEIEKLFLKKKNILYIVVSALIPIIGAALARALGNRIGIYVITPSYFPILILSLLVNIIIPLFIFSTAADLFAGERSERTLKIVLIRPVTRFKIYYPRVLQLYCLVL
jgi:ABC-2 type transport system permease protein